MLSIPRLRLDVPVFEGTDELTLNRGAGRIAGTAQLGEQGNIGIAAHRDGFFRSLKDVRVGDRIELAQLRHKFVYTVDNISVVGPSDLTVLQARPQPSLTLVTCYPFYFIGDAPQRYIVQASLVNSEQDLTETVARNFKTEQGEITVNPRYEFQRALLVLAVGGFGLILNSNVSAQVQTQTFTTPGQPTTEVKVDRGTVVLVDGNDLVVKVEDGHLVHFANLPESARATVDGQELGIHDLKPGMTLERTITTTTTPQMITTVKHVTGTVWSVNPPSSVILTLEDGTNQAFKIPDGQKFNIDGQMTDAWGLRKGMKVSATKVTEVPETVVEQEKAVTGTMPPPDPPADLPILVLVVLPVDAPTPDPVQTAVVATDSLPKTASQLPLVGMLGILALLSGLALRAVRVLG